MVPVWGRDGKKHEDNMAAEHDGPLWTDLF
jgi:hypothetical protein